jgi:hypothetical protein
LTEEQAIGYVSRRRLRFSDGGWELIPHEAGGVQSIDEKKNIPLEGG